MVENKDYHNGEEQTVYAVEMFIPARCPNPMCRNEFTQNGKDGYYLGTYFLHEPEEVAREITDSITASGLITDLIVCAKCRNIVMRVRLEERMYEHRADAEIACLTEGFVNLRVSSAFGNMRVQGMRRMILRANTWQEYQE